MTQTSTSEAAGGTSAVVPVGYYDLPFLKRPTWGWEIALYFFLGGISAGSFVLAAMADLFGGKRHRRLVRTARYVSLGTVLPCAPLLIADLGRPAKFSHMLRVFKPRSPMNTGAWALFGFSQLAAMAALLERRRLLPAGPQRSLEQGLSVAGLPFALTILAYPGVLLSTSSTPIWANTRWLGALLGISSFSAACDTLALAGALAPRSRTGTRAALDTSGRVARAAETGVLAAYLYTAGETSAPIVRGRYARPFWAGVVAAGLVLSTVLQRGGRKTGSRKAGVVGSVLSVMGSLALKWIVVHAGRESAASPKANRAVSRAA